MTLLELLADTTARNLNMLKMTLADFTDSDMMVRPCPGAKHALWHLGHLLCGEVHMVRQMAPGVMPALPAGLADKFNGKTAEIDDPGFFGTNKAQLLEQFDKVRAATVGWIRSLTEADLNRPAPEALRAWFPTVGHMVHLLSDHVTMHVGQLQVARRKLGKPVLF